jgi:hypothetical protein
MAYTQFAAGETYHGVVDRISGRGNAIVEPSGSSSHINLGPLPEDAVGEEVRYRYVGQGRGECLTEVFRTKNYREAILRRDSSKHRQANPVTSSTPSNKNKLLNGKL